MLDKTIPDIIKRNSVKFEDYLFLEDELTKIRLNFKEFELLTNKIANYLLSLKVKKSQHIGLVLSNRAEFILLYFGIIKAGASVVPINQNFTSYELDEIINRTDCIMVFSEISNKEKLADCNVKVVFIDENNFLDQINKFPDNLQKIGIDEEDIAVVTFSSGTTGLPKAILLSHRHIIKVSKAVNERYQFKPGHKFLCVQPLFFFAHLLYIYQTLFYGGTLAISKGFSKTNFWKLAERYQPDHIQVVPTMLAMLLNPPEDISKYKLKLNNIFSASAPLPLSLLNKFEDQFNIPVIDNYGINEVGYPSMGSFDLSIRKKGSVGRPLSIYDVKVVDPNDIELKPNEQGEIIVKGSLFSSYYKNEEAYKMAVKDGWYYTGDIGYKDEEGYFYITGRLKFIINKGGEKIIPREVDTILLQHQAVAESQTIGIPDDIFGEEVKSFVVLKKNKKASGQELIDHCKKYLAKIKCPRFIQFIDSVPTNASGKPSVQKLLDLHKNRV